MAAIDVEYLQLVTRHQPAIYGYIRSLAPGADIEDILQETNLVLWEKSAIFQPGSNFKAFAFRIAHLQTLEALRAERRRHWLVFDTDLLESIGTHRRLSRRQPRRGGLRRASARAAGKPGRPRPPLPPGRTPRPARVEPWRARPGARPRRPAPGPGNCQNPHPLAIACPRGRRGPRAGPGHQPLVEGPPSPPKSG